MKLISPPPHMMRIQKGIFRTWLFLATVACLCSAIWILTSDEPLLVKSQDIFIIAAFCFSAWTLYRFTTGELANEVFDNKDHLIVRKGKTQVAIHFSEIASVERRIGSKILVRLSQPTELGNRIVFYPSFRRLENNLESTMAVLKKRAEDYRQQVETSMRNSAMMNTT